MRLNSLLLMLVCGMFAAESIALELPKLPFIMNNKADFRIELNGNPQLHKALIEELVYQRSNNLQLQQYKDVYKIIRYETQLLIDRLRADGYYKSEIKANTKDGNTLYKVELGPLYHIQNISVELPDSVTISSNQILDIKEGSPLRAKLVLDAKKALADQIEKAYCLYQIEVDYKVTVIHESQTAHVTFRVKNSPQVFFGEISFQGLSSLEEDYLKKRIPFKKGDCFKRTTIHYAQVLLMQSNLFVRAEFQMDEPVGDQIPITLYAVERFHRTVSAGAGFQSNQGLGLSMNWEHRNVLGRAEKLSFDTYIGDNLQTLLSTLDIPNYRKDKQTLSFFADLKHENTDVFKSQLATIGVEVARQLRRSLRGRIGAELQFSEAREVSSLNDSESVTLFSLPVSLEYDKRDDPLNPRSGFVMSGRFRPYWHVDDYDNGFLKSTLAASFYFTVDDFFWRPTIAVRGAFGAISGSDPDQVPINERYYVGGGGSVRAYSYQSLGPLENNIPAGGLSFTELSLETRFQWSGDWGGVLFIDGGYAFEQELPKLGRDLHWGAGIGLRYFTSFAPIRFDIAMPLNKRDDIDDGFQLYISIGQAF